MASVISGDWRQKKNKFITLALLAFLLMSVSIFLVQRDDPKTIIVTFPNGTELEAEIADTPEKLLFGLAFQEALPPNGGMIYIFETTGMHRVSTKAYQFPIDMIWVDESHHIVKLVEQVAPCQKDPCPWYSSDPDPVRYAIQTEAGFIKRQGLTTGGELKYTLHM